MTKLVRFGIQNVHIRKMMYLKNDMGWENIAFLQKLIIFVKMV